MSRKKDHLDEKFQTDPHHVLEWLQYKASQAHLLKLSKNTLTEELTCLSFEFFHKISKIVLKPQLKTSSKEMNHDEEPFIDQSVASLDSSCKKIKKF